MLKLKGVILWGEEWFLNNADLRRRRENAYGVLFKNENSFYRAFKVSSCMVLDIFVRGRLCCNKWHIKRPLKDFYVSKKTRRENKMRFFDKETGEELMMSINELWSFRIVSAFQNMYDGELELIITPRDKSEYIIINDTVFFRNGAIARYGRFLNDEKFFFKNQWWDRASLIYRAFTGDNFRRDQSKVIFLDGNPENCCIDNLKKETFYRK